MPTISSSGLGSSGTYASGQPGSDLNWSTVRAARSCPPAFLSREKFLGRRAQRACEGAARGVGVPASDRAGVWGGAPRDEVSHSDLNALSNGVRKAALVATNDD